MTRPTALRGPPPKRDARDSILNAAEAVFAAYGYDRATTRDIADAAATNLALIHYHFQSKENLFEAVVARRAEVINGRRRDLLRSSLVQPRPAWLEGIFDALMRPTIELGNDKPHGQNYSRIAVQIASGTDERSRRLTAKYFDGIAYEFIEALQACTPGLATSTAVWAYLNAISIGLLMMARTGRAVALSAGTCDESGTEEAISRVVCYLAAGTRAMASSGPPMADRSQQRRSSQRAAKKPPHLHSRG